MELINRSIKAIFFDLDGTLVDRRDNTIPISTQKALHELRKRGIKLFIASGRPPIWEKEIYEHFDFVFDGKVLFNGQYCVDETNTPFYRNPLKTSQLQAILTWMDRHPEVACKFMEPDYVYSNMDLGKVHKDDLTRCLKNETFQVSPQMAPEFDADILKSVEGVKSARWNNTSTDLIPYDGGKTVGMQKMLEKYGLDKTQCMAFGDGDNDIEMLQYVEIGIAMGNAGNTLKQVADYITDAVDEEGIANALLYFGLIGG